MDQNHVSITIDQEVGLSTRMKQPPELLQESAANNSCIFRVPQSLAEFNPEACRPRIVSIGPYHCGGKDLEMIIQDQKWRYFDDFIKRTSKPRKFFMDIIVSMDAQIRESYSESTNRFSTNELAEMMLVDGVFLIELFKKVGNLVSVHQNDPIFRKFWVSPSFITDLLKIENQIPFFVLQKLFDESKTDERTHTLPSLILEFFNYLVPRKPKVLEEYKNLDGKHILDLFRKSFINTKNRDFVRRSDYASLLLIQPATKLAIAGVKFKANHQAESFLDIEFKNGCLYIPEINMDEHFYSSFFLNCLAFERYSLGCSNDITSYIVFIRCLMNSSKDARLLSRIVNYFGTDEEIVKFFNHLGKDVVYEIDNNYLQGLYQEVNDYCKNDQWHGVWGVVRHTYNSTSQCTFISALASFMLLSLAAIQTYYTVYPFYY